MIATSITAACLIAALASQEASPAPEERPKVAILGTYHMGNPGLDVFNLRVDDVTSELRQDQLWELCDLLAEFAPTKIAVEALPSAQSVLDRNYRAWRNGTRELERDEREQIGYRLAGELNLPCVHAIDASRDLALQDAFDYAKEHGPETLDRWFKTTRDVLIPTMQRWLDEGTVLEVHQKMNDAALLRDSHELYLMLPEVGTAENPIGARVAADWYARNLDIFGNLCRLAEPGDRILVVYGSGHAALLNEFVDQSPQLDHVAVSTLLQ